MDIKVCESAFLCLTKEELTIIFLKSGLRNTEGAKSNQKSAKQQKFPASNNIPGGGGSDHSVIFLSSLFFVFFFSLMDLLGC